MLAVWPFEVMEGKLTLEADFTGRRQDLEEGDRFESSDLRLERCCFLALLRVDTLVSRFVEGTELILPSVGFVFHEAKASWFRPTPSPQASLYHGREEG